MSYQLGNLGQPFLFCRKPLCTSQTLPFLHKLKGFRNNAFGRQLKAADQAFYGQRSV